MQNGKYLGIDFGSKRVGLSVTDESKTLAFPHLVLKNSENLIDEVGKVLKDQNISKIVIGDSKDFNNKDNPIMLDIRRFKEDLERKFNIEVDLHPEFLTTHEARRTSLVRNVDSSASAIMLQNYIDSKK